MLEKAVEKGEIQIRWRSYTSRLKSKDKQAVTFWLDSLTVWDSTPTKKPKTIAWKNTISEEDRGDAQEEEVTDNCPSSLSLWDVGAIFAAKQSADDHGTPFLLRSCAGSQSCPLPRLRTGFLDMIYVGSLGFLGQAVRGPWCSSRVWYAHGDE